MKSIDRLADKNKGHYVVPKAPIKQSDKQMSSIISKLKEQNNNPVK